MLEGADTAEEYRLRDGPSIELDAAGFLHPKAPRSKQTAFTRYVDVTHLAVSDRGVWVATEDDLVILPRQRFEEPQEAERLGRTLLERIRARPGGAAVLERMKALDSVGQGEVKTVATWSLVGVCLLAFAAEYFVQPEVVLVGQFSPGLTLAGDLWRVATANLLHGGPLHLIFNLFGLVVLGRLVERMLGGVRTVCVMGGSAVGAMGLSGLFGEDGVVGASGVVLGLGGALLALEFLRRHEQPVWWRFPRSLRHLLVVALLLDLALGFAVPIIAGAAHLGGFLGGAAAATLVTRRGLAASIGSLSRTAARGVVAASAASILWAGAELARGEYVARHALRVAELPEIGTVELNNVAWLIAIDPDATRAELDAALQLAERAVSESGAESATLLDTLAEVQFHLGRPEEAIATIDRAIALDPEEPYYREQRRRYTGERPAHDRPPDPLIEPPTPRVPWRTLETEAEVSV